MLIVRDARPRDLDGLMTVARHLNSVNLPADPAFLERAIALSQSSFAGVLPIPSREYLFVLCDGAAEGRLVGASMILARHGTPDAPHVFFDVGTEERYSAGLGRCVSHRVLRIGYSFDGPTELGGLILLPEYRGGARRAGKLLSFVRFLYIGSHRPWFRDEVLAELLPPFEPDGTSVVWNSIGARLTGLSYAEADRRSREDKEFIRTLFPEGPIYVCLLPFEAQALLGRVGPATRGVERMLIDAGMRHTGRIDPFDGGPHLSARTDDLAPIGALRSARVERGWTGPGTDAIIGASRADGLVAVLAPCRLREDRVTVDALVAEALEVADGALVWVLPAPRSAPGPSASRDGRSRSDHTTEEREP